jgi:hypothetical protein
LVRPNRVHVEILSLKEPAEERRRFIRDADNLVRCLTIEFEIELRLGPTVFPVGKKFELAPPQAPLRERGAFDGDAHVNVAGGLRGGEANQIGDFERGAEARHGIARGETFEQPVRGMFARQLGIAPFRLFQ